MNRSPTPGGVFAPHFVGGRGELAECSQRYCRPSAAVGVQFIAPAYT